MGDSGFQNMTEESSGKMIDIYLDQKEAEAKLERQYVAKIKSVLSPRQTWRFIRFEGDFRRSLMEKMSGGEDDQSKKQRGQRGGY